MINAGVGALLAGFLTLNTNGAGEIEANNRRLASTKRSVSLAAKHLEAIEREQTAKEKAFKIAQDALKIAQNGFKMAEKELNAARKNTDDAKKEQQEAEADLKHAEECAEAAQKKWEVIDLAIDEDGSKQSEMSDKEN